MFFTKRDVNTGDSEFLFLFFFSRIKHYFWEEGCELVLSVPTQRFISLLFSFLVFSFSHRFCLPLPKRSRPLLNLLCVAYMDVLHILGTLTASPLQT